MNHLKHRVRLLRSLGLAVTTSIFCSLPSHAQIEEIVVTAEKRLGNVQDIPIAISAFDADALKNAGIDDALDIQFSVPNVVFSRGNFTGSNMSIRGVGNSAVGVSSDSGAGVHVNGVYLNAPRIFETEFFDVERVEMLRGPQGTLYGRNTTAGVVNVITAKPGDELAADIGVTYGNYNTIKLNGMVNIPIGESISQRFAVFSLDRDGYVDNIYTGNDVDDRDMYAIRSTTLFNLRDDLDATLTLSKFREDDSRSRNSKQQCISDPAGVLGCLPTGLGFDVYNSNAGVSGALGVAIGLLNPGVDQFANSNNPDDLRKINADFDPRYFVEEALASLEFNWRFDNLTFTSLTAYSETFIDTMTDYDWAVPSVDFNYPVLNYFNGVERFDAVRDGAVDSSSDDNGQFSQEFRLSSDNDGMFNFTTGLFAMKFETENHYTIWFPVGHQYGQLIPVPIPEEQSIFDNHTKSYQVETWALFGEGYWQVSDATKLTLGLRYTDEQKEADSRQLYLNFKSNITDPYAHQEDDWQEVTGKIGIDLNLDLPFTDSTLLYATLARGYKGGGFNPPGSTASSDSFDPEYINSIEFGAKNSFFDNILQANIGVFYYDYEGLQVSKIIEQTSINENVDSTISGIEAELVFSPNENWRAGLNLSYLNAEIGDFQSFDPADPAQTGSAAGVVSIFGDNCLPPIVNPGTCLGSNPGIDVDLEGNALPNSPEFSVNGNIEYTVFWGAGYSLSSRLQYYWQDEYYSRIFNTKKDTIDSWSMLDAQFTLRGPSSDWSAQLWIKNIKDDDHVTGHYIPDATSGLFTNVFVLEPRTFGLSVNYSF